VTGLPEVAVARAQQLAAIVHGDGDVEDVADLLHECDTDGLYALAVTLAAMVDVDRCPSDLLAWADLSVCPVCHRVPTARGGNVCGGEGSLCARNRRAYWRDRKRAKRVASVDEVAVQRALSGQQVTVPRGERGEALARLLAAGLTPTEAGRRLRLSGASVRRLMEVS